MSVRTTRTLASIGGAALLLFGATAGAQPFPPPPPGPGPGPGPAPAAGPARPLPPAAMAPTNVEGVVERWLVNPDGEIDALLLAGGGLVRFPPHLDKQLAAVARPGDRITATGRPEANGRDVTAYTIRNVATGQQVVDTPPDPFLPKLPKHVRYAALQPMDLSGTVERQLYGPRGEVNGVLLKGGDVVRFPPQAFYIQAEKYTAGAPFAASGRGSVTAYGRALEAEAFGPTPAQLQPVYR